MNFDFDCSVIFSWMMTLLSHTIFIHFSDQAKRLQKAYEELEERKYWERYVLDSRDVGAAKN